MNLQQLQYLVAVAKHGTITAAAASIPVAQPAVSRALAALEQELRTPLLRRVGRTVELTDVGLEVVAIAAEILDGVTRIRETASSTWPITIASMPVFEEMFAACMIGTAAGTPGVRVAFRPVETVEDAYELVRNGTADMAIGRSDVPLDDLDAVPIGDLEIGLAVRRPHDLPTPVPITALHRLPIVWYPSGSRRAIRILERLADAGVEPTIAVRTGDQLSWPGLVAAGHTHALLPMFRPITFPDVEVLPIDPPVTFGLGLVSRPLGSDDPLRLLRDRLADTCRANGPQRRT